MKKEVKGIIFSDFDETLYSSKLNEVKEGTWEAITRAKNNNFVTCLITGRPYSSFEKFLNKDLINSFDYIATDNGARMFEIVNGNLQLLHLILLPDDIMKEINEYIINNNVAAIHNGEHGATKTADTIYPKNKIIWKGDLETTIPDSAIQINIDGNHPNLLPSWQQNWLPNLTTISSKAGKAIVVEHLKEMFPNVITYAFGDEGNDIQMFKHVDCPIAMHHSNPKLIKYAKEILEPGFNVQYYINKILDDEKFIIETVEKVLKIDKELNYILDANSVKSEIESILKECYKKDNNKNTLLQNFFTTCLTEADLLQTVLTHLEKESKD